MSTIRYNNDREPVKNEASECKTLRWTNEAENSKDVNPCASFRMEKKEVASEYIDTAATIRTRGDE